MQKTSCGLIIALLVFTNLGLHQALNMLPIPASQNNPPLIPTEISSLRGRFTLQFQTHAPISIYGNSGFASQAMAEGWPGTGTKTDPYIIKGLNISDYSSELIKIRNSNVYFIISNCVLTNGTTGIYFEYVSNGQIINNTITKNNDGIVLWFSANNILSNNTLNKNEEYGIALRYSADNTLTLNTFSKNGLYIHGGNTVEECIQQKVDNNTVNGKPLVFWQHVVGGIVPAGVGQIILINTSAVTVHDQQISDASVGIQAWFSDSLELSYNTLSSNHVYGIGLFYSAECIITLNSLNNNKQGIQLMGSVNNTITDNTLIKNGNYGIGLSSSADNTITQNILSNKGLYVFGDTIEDCLQQKVDNNTVNGKPLVFWQHVVGGIVPVGVGQIILINTSAVTVRDQQISNGYIGIQSWFSNFLDLSNNILSNNSRDGISLRDSKNNTLTNNTLNNNNDSGISLWDSDDNTLTNNTLNNNSYSGISLWRSANNTLRYNILTNNSGGIHLYASFTNNVAKNNFIGNNPGGGSQAFDKGGNDNTFSHNYWADWTGPDSDEDGIVDVPYEIGGDYQNQDGYPVTVPYEIGPHLLTIPTLTFPRGGETLIGVVTIHWRASMDSWGHSVTYSVAYSADGGVTWTILTTDVPVTHYDWDTTIVDDGTTYLIQVNASCSRGMWLVATSAAVFTIDNVPPTTSTSSTSSSPSSTQPGIPLNLLPVLQMLGLGVILVFVVTLVIIIRRQQMG